MDLLLSESVVVVTGGSSGIGLALVQMLLEEGAKVATCARNLERLLIATADISTRYTDKLFCMSCDVRSVEEVNAFIAATVEKFGRIDGLVNNAGQSRMKPFAQTTWDDWTDELELKFASVVHPVKAALEALRRSPHASIVNVNAILAHQPETRLVTTSAARAGVLNLSKSLSIDLAADAIRVNSVCLGLIDTGQWRKRYEDSDKSLTWEQWTAELTADRGVSLGRLGEANEVAYVIATLLSPRASYVTGTSIDIGGGVNRNV
jgi:NAD(P)-dependent dehydrogenase (short-subunit alcohol dehydrogenase family)